MAYRKPYLKKNGTFVQGHFTKTRSKSYSGKNQGCMLVILMALTFGLAISCSESSDCPTKTCGSFSTQAQAQSTYDSDRSCYKNLDSDGDGIACENLQKK